MRSHLAITILIAVSVSASAGSSKHEMIQKACDTTMPQKQLDRFINDNIANSISIDGVTINRVSVIDKSSGFVWARKTSKKYFGTQQGPDSTIMSLRDYSFYNYNTYTQGSKLHLGSFNNGNLRAFMLRTPSGINILEMYFQYNPDVVLRCSYYLEFGVD